MTAAAALRRAQEAYRAGDADACRASLEVGLAQAQPGSSLEAQMKAVEARLLMWERGALDEARAAHRLARTANAPMWEPEIALGTALFMRGDLEAIRHLDAAAAAGATTGERAEAHLMAGAALHALGELRKARRRWSTARAEGTRARRRDIVALARYGDAHSAMMLAGDYDYAIRELTAAQAGPVGMLADEVRGVLAIALADIGDRRASDVLDENEGIPAAAWNRAYLLYARTEVEWAEGRLNRCIAIAEECADLGIPHLAERALLNRGWARLEAGLEPDVASTWEVDGPLEAAHRFDAAGLRALSEKDAEAARTAFLEAARLNRRLWMRAELRSLLGAAAAADLLGDADEAKRLRAVVARRARRHGIAAILRRLDTPLAPTRKLSLTPRRRQVLELVGEGVASREIAHRLSISRATVETHIRAVLTSTGARTRIEAAARALPRSRSRKSLPPEDQRIIDLLADGATVSDAALLLHLSRRTLTRRLARIRARTGASSNAELVAWYRRASNPAAR